MSERKKERAAWIGSYATGRNRGLLTRIRADGETGTDGERGRRLMHDGTADHLLAIMERSGVGTTDARRYLIDLLRWHYGYSAGRAAPTPSLARMTAADAAYVRQRAYTLVREQPIPGHPIVNNKLAT